MHDEAKSSQWRRWWWPWGPVAVLACLPFLAFLFWIWATRTAERNFDEAVRRLHTHRSNEVVAKPATSSSELRDRHNQARTEFLHRLFDALKIDVHWGDTRMIRAQLIALAPEEEWEKRTAGLSDEQLAVICEPLALFLADPNTDDEAMRFEQIEMNALIARERRSGQLAPGKLRPGGSFSRLVRLARARDLEPSRIGHVSALQRSVGRAVEASREVLTAEQSAEFVAAAAELGVDDPAMHREWLKRWEDRIYGATDVWRRRARSIPTPAPTSKSKSSRIPPRATEDWRTRLMYPWTTARFARALSGLAELVGEVKEGRSPRGQALAEISRVLQFTSAAKPKNVPTIGFDDGLRLLRETAERRAVVVAWWARIETLAGRELAPERCVPEWLRTDPCSELPFRVRRHGNDILVHGLGFDRDDDGGRLALQPRTAPYSIARVEAELIDGDILVRVPLP